MRHPAALRVLPLYLGVGATGVVALVAIPVMIAAGGLQQWTDIAVGQSVGGVIAAVVSYGWGITGPADVAAGGPAARRREYAESVKTRLSILPIALLVGSILVASVTGFAALPVALFGLLSTSLTGMSAMFYFLGTGQLWRSFLCESAPRAAGTLAGVVLCISAPGVSAVAVPVGTSAGAVAALLISTLSVNGGLRDPAPLERRRVSHLLVLKRHGLITSVATGAFQVVPTLVVGWFAPSVLSSYVFYDRMYKQAMTFLSPALNVFQGWVPRATGDRRVRRMRLSLLVSVVAGLFSVAAAILVGGWIVENLSASEFQPDILILTILGLLVAFSAIDLVVSRVGLVVKNRLDALAVSSFSSFVGGVLLVAIAAPITGVVGALAATAVGVMLRVAYSAAVFARTPWAD